MSLSSLFLQEKNSPHTAIEKMPERVPQLLPRGSLLPPGMLQIEYGSPSLPMIMSITRLK